MPFPAMVSLLVFSDCACQKNSTWTKVKEAQNLRASLPFRFAVGDYAGVFGSAKRIKDLFDQLEVMETFQLKFLKIFHIIMWFF